MMRDKMDAVRNRFVVCNSKRSYATSLRLALMQRNKPDIEAARSGYEERKRVLLTESLKNFAKLINLVVSIFQTMCAQYGQYHSGPAAHPAQEGRFRRTRARPLQADDLQLQSGE